MTTRKDKPGNYAFPEIATPTSSSRQGMATHWQAPPESLAEKVQAAEAQAYEEGYHQGRNRALPAEMARVQPLNDLLAVVMGVLDTHRHQIHAAGAQETVRLGMAMARDILHHDIRRQPERVEAAFREILARAAGQERVKVNALPIVS
ncbi:MAG: hypothetical protein KFF50_17920, partial [Desulfatitalea sp.]|nr:hypothetical protein [Desulfatitalea sp.]